MKYKSINFLNQFFNDIIHTECENIIEKISSIYNLNINEINEEIFNNDFKKNYKNQINDIINKNTRCLGLIKSGCQCLRSRQNGYNYCKIHQKTLKFGKKII